MQPKLYFLRQKLLRCNCQTHSTILFSYIRDALHKFTYLFFVSPVYRAVGHKMYGTQYREKLSETIRRAAEFCDCLQCFFVLHSMGGGKEKARVFFFFTYKVNMSISMWGLLKGDKKYQNHTIQIPNTECFTLKSDFLICYCVLKEVQ